MLAFWKLNILYLHNNFFSKKDNQALKYLKSPRAG